MLIRPSTPGYVKPRGDWPILVSIRYLDSDYVAELAERNLIASLRFSRDAAVRAGEQETLLTTEAGDPIGYLIWRPELPGSQIFAILGPLTVGFTLFICMLIGMLARRLIRTTTELADAEATASTLAFQDVLTGLPNRALLNQRLDAALAVAQSDCLPALLLVDLDRFKQINDALGHQAGDLLLVEFGRRVSSMLGPRDMVARLGGDEFAVLLADATSSRVQFLCSGILDAAAEPFDMFGKVAFVGASIGAAFAPWPLCGATELTRRADVALYAAKGGGRGCARFFSTRMDAVVRERAAIEDELRSALASGSLTVWYQPEVARDGRILGVEALLRWQHPTRGLIGPEQFIAVAEDTGLIHDLGAQVMRAAADAAARWPHLFVAVNLSAIQFRSAAFAERITAIVQAAGVEPGRIELEVTEHALLDADDAVRSKIERLRTSGFRLALDDFGTGYSSLSYLQRFRVDKIKIDRSFVRHLPASVDSQAIVAAIATLGRTMGLTVTAEGVETEDQFDALAALGCREFQGYLFSPARPADEIEALMRTGRMSASTETSPA